MKPFPTKLPLHEWCIILLFCFILLAIAGYAFVGTRPLPSYAFAAEPEAVELVIKVEGEVAHPGLYHLPLKSTLKELLEQVEPLPSADLSRLSNRRRLKDGQTILVPERRWITIKLAGAVANPGPLQILSGTRWYEVMDKLQPLPEADLRNISKRRSFLKEGDKIEVPYKKATKKSTKKKNPKRN